MLPIETGDDDPDTGDGDAPNTDGRCSYRNRGVLMLPIQIGGDAPDKDRW